MIVERLGFAMEEVIEHCIGEVLGECSSHRSDLDSSYVIVILNYKLPSLVASLWDRAKLRLCADGGANRLYNELPLVLNNQDKSTVQERYIPDAIIGDLDSIDPGIRNFYATRGTAVLDNSHDQDTVDLHKCVSFVIESTQHVENSNMKIVVVGALGGRFDHEMGNINVLHSFRQIRIILLNDESLVYLLPKGSLHRIHLSTAFEGPNCGLIPLGEASKSTTTTGLKWNLDETPTGFGALVSTPNILVSNEVTVRSDCDLLWTTRVHKKMGNSSPRLIDSKQFK